MRHFVPTIRISTLTLVMTTIMSYSVLAASPRTDLTYKVFAGGINAVEAKMSVVSEQDNYKLFFVAKTRGFLGKLAPWAGSFESYGWSENGLNHVPEKHTAVSTWRKEKETKEYFYKKDRTFDKLTITEDSKVKPSDKLDPKITNNTTDLLAATMNVMSNAVNSRKCEGTSVVFDGKRRFDLVFKPGKNESLKASKYNIFEGETIKCVVEVKPISGRWHEKPRGWMSIQEQGRELGTLPTIWFGQVEKGGIYVPVKVRVKTNYGVLFMHLKSFKTFKKTSHGTK